MKKKSNKAFLCPIIIGIILVAAGLIIQIPGGALTTLEILNGRSTDNYVFDNKYSSIDEYVGGDAYNYIIGASLVAGKITGAMVAKTICIVGGSMCICFGMTLMMLMKKKDNPNEITVLNGIKETNTPETSVNSENKESQTE